MWLPVFLFILAGALATEHEHAWKVGQEYNYLVRSRTLTGLDHLSNQYTGILIKAQLTVQPKDQETLRARVRNAQYANLHQELPDDWDSEISDRKLEIRDMPMSGKPFEIKTKHGVFRDLIVDRDVPTWEVNILKSIVGQLQVDTQGENAIRSRSTQVPEEDSPYAMFKAMEDSVGGKCEVLYDITPLSEDVLQKKPELVPIPKLKGDGQHIDIIKTKNYSRCEQRMDYHFGITGKTNWEPGSNDNGRLLSKSSTSRIVISGDLNRFTIQSSVTTNKVFVSPRFHNHRTGMVASRMNLTLVNVDKTSQPIDRPRNPQSAGNLVYTYNNPFSETSQRKPGKPTISLNSREGKDSGSRSAVSSSEERQAHGKRNSGSDSASSSSISSSEENDFWQPKPTLQDPPENPLLPYFIGNKGKSITLQIDPVQTTKNLVEEIAKEIEDPSQMPTKETLDKFAILIELIRTMNKKQISEVGANLHLSENELKSFQLKKENAWAVFRDAMIEAGTGPALLVIKGWIENEMIKGLEAADALSRISATAQAPTAEYVDEFFKLATKRDVMNDDIVGSAALLAFAKLVHQSQISNRTLHNRYPVHSFGRLAPKHDQVVLEKYLPFFDNQLRNAIKDEHRRKAQIYITVLGHIAHPKILAIFEPYLEGKEQATVMQRTMMVGALSRLAELHPKLARSVLYKIYLNTMEAHDVRCMAVFLLMKTNPPLSMLQRMAEFTNYDMNKNVNSAVKSMIEEYAGMQLPEYKEMAEKAQIARKLLTPVSYDDEYSTSYMTANKVKDDNLAYTLLMNYIGSDDSAYPKAFYAGVDTTYGDFKAPTSAVSYMTSSLKSLRRLFSERKDVGESPSEKIAKMLGIEPEDAVPVEGHVLWEDMYSSWLFTFDEETIRKIPDWFMKNIARPSGRSSINFVRMTNYEVTISFPLETGLPFVYSATVPHLLKITGKQDPKDGSAELRIAFSKKLQGRMGFVAPFEHHQYIAGVDVSFQFYIPIKLRIKTDFQRQTYELQAWPLKDDRNVRMFHYSVIPYTSRRDILSLRPVLTDKNTHKVHTTDEIDTIKQQLGPSKMPIFKFNVEADDASELMPDFDQMDFSEMMLFRWSQHDDKYRTVDIYANLENVEKHPFAVKVVLDSMQTESDPAAAKHWQPKSEAIEPKDKEPDSQARRKKFLEEVSKGMSAADARVMDVKVEIPAIFHNKNALTFAWAESRLDEKVRALLFWRFSFADKDMNYEVCSALQGNSNFDSAIDYTSASTIKPKAEFDMDFRYGKTCLDNGQVRVSGKMRQSDEMRDSVKKSELVKECQEQLKQDNKLLKTCRKATSAALATDEVEISVETDFPPFHTAVNKAVDFMKDVIETDMDIDASEPKNAGKNKIDIEMHLATDLKSANIVLYTPSFDVTFSNVDLELLEDESDKGEEYSEYLVDAVPEYACVLDITQVETFDLRRYPVKLGKCWHVLMVTKPRKSADKSKEWEPLSEDTRVSILAREVENGRELKVILGDRKVHFKPSESGLKATVNGREITYSKDIMHQEKEGNTVLFELYELSDGSARLVSDVYGVDIYYDGKRIAIDSDDQFRNSIRGLCGNYDGDTQNDFITPKDCYLKSPEEFISTYALLDDQCEGPSVENAKKARQSDCSHRSIRLSNVISESEAGRVSENRNWGYHRTEGRRGPGQCNVYRTKVIDHNDKICFSTRPVPTCAAGCRTAGQQLKKYQFHCMEKTESAIEMKKRVEKGANPDLSQKPVSLSQPINVDIQCQA